ncbi:MAG TPA: redoxin family protein [Polyangia bacterium]
MGRPAVEGTSRGGWSVLAAAMTVLLSMTGDAAAAPADQVAPTSDEEKAAARLVGTRPPEWRASEWLNTAPLRLQDLRGKVVVVRWWTAGCPYCSASAPALRHLDDKYRLRGVVVVGMYHHKEDGPFDPAVYRETARKYGFRFPLAVDRDWRTLKSWLGDVNTGFTSVTFVLDRKGIVRHVHPGGEIVDGAPGARKIHDIIEALLRESD